MSMQIRDFRPDDVDAVSRMINASIIKLNSKDYPPKIIHALCDEFSATNLRELMTRRQIVIALDAGQPIGTASLEHDTVHGVFVHPRHIGRGIGALLMDHVEQTAARQGISTLFVPASLTAHGFYRKLDYLDLRQVETEAVGMVYLMSKSVSLAN